MNIDPDAFMRGTLRIPELKGASPLPPGKVYRARGCSSCLDTGYQGRTGIYELLMLNDEVRTLALKNADATQIKRAGIKNGMRTLRQDGALKVLAGMTTIEEVMMVTAEDVH
jgi:general secretion pathway protein E